MAPVTLRDIVAATRQRLPALRRRRLEFEREAARAAAPRNWLAAFARQDLAVVAEVKRRSPSSGVIATDLDPATHARAYERGGARAISVLTDGPFFGGSLDDLRAVHGAVALPILRKDFIVDPVQLYEARAAGASAVLLIARVLDRSGLRELSLLARDLGLGTLIEVHEAGELEQVLAAEPEVVGVNSRNLETFEVDVEATAAVIEAIPRGVVVVAESGLGRRADVERVAGWGADAVLVGAAVAGAGDPEAAVRAMTGVTRRARN